VAGHVFVSYSHHDHAYVAQLSQYLRTYGFQLLTDEGIEPGDQWAHTIEDHVRTCAAFIPVMSINSRKADWVRREILFAQDLQKPILPLLLSGTRFIEVVDLHDEDVTTGGLPRQPFMTRLHSILFAELTNLHGEAVSLGISGEYAEAARILREVIAARTRVLGAEHVDTLESRYELAGYLGGLGEYAEAASVLREVIAARTRVLGAEHVDTLKSLEGLAFILGCVDEYAEAEQILREVVAARTRVQGAEHADTLESRYDLAVILGISGKKAETAAKNAPTLRSMRAVYAARSRVLEAVRILREVVAARTRLLGAKHPDTRSAVEALRTYE
jgi:hypothetical protein